MCNYNGHRTWRDECCEAWKPKEKETNMVEVVRCKDCKHYHQGFGCDLMQRPSVGKDLDWFCADGEMKEQ